MCESTSENPFKDICTSLPNPDGGEFRNYYSLTALNDPRIDKLSYSIKILLESAIRNCDNFQVTKNDVEKIIDWENTSPKQVEIPFKPARVLLQVNAYCGDQNLQSYDAYNSWLNISESVLNKKCGVDGDDKPFDFGIFEQALSSGIVYSKNFISKYCYCMWWGLQNLSTLGQGLQTSTYPGESIFSIALAIFGLILFALLIGNMQVPVDLVIDHSVQVDVARHENAVQANMDLEFKRNYERFAFLKWGSTAFQNMLVVPPGSGIVHQSSGFGPDK